MNLLKSEVVDSAYNTLFTEMTEELRDSKTNQGADPSTKKQGQPPLPFDFLPESKFKKAEYSLKMQPDLLYDLLEIDEQEKIIMHKFVAIRPVAVVATSMGQVGRVAPLASDGPPSVAARGFNKGHIINAGILYILESGQLKIVTSTGTVLVEKSITFDINPQSFKGQQLADQDEIVALETSPNPEDMRIFLITKFGRLIIYKLNIERQVDESHLVEGLNETQVEPTADPDSNPANTTQSAPEDAEATLNSTKADIERARASQQERRQLLLEEQERLRNTLFEYTISDQEKTIFTVDGLLEKQKKEAQNATQEEQTAVKQEEEVESNKTHEYSNLVHFVAKGKLYLFTVRDGEELMRIDVRKDREQVVEYSRVGEISKKHGNKIVSIQRFSAYVLVQYENILEFFEFEGKSHLQTSSKIALSEKIHSVQQDLMHTRFLYVQTESQVYLYDCDAVLQNQYSTLVAVRQKGCKFLKRLLPFDNQDQVTSFQVLRNSIMVFYQDRSDIIYIKELLQYYKSPAYQQFPKESILLIASHPGPSDSASIVASAKTQQNSLFLRASQAQLGTGLVHRLHLQQFIPLPDLELGVKATSQMDNAFEEMRTPIFLIVFIGVLLVQIFYRQKKQAAEDERALAGMGPLEKSLRGRAPNGRALSAKQLREVQDIDRMLGDMGQLADDVPGAGARAGGGGLGGGLGSRRRGYGQDRNSDVD